MQPTGPFTKYVQTHCIISSAQPDEGGSFYDTLSIDKDSEAWKVTGLAQHHKMINLSLANKSFRFKFKAIFPIAHSLPYSESHAMRVTTNVF